jgi:hypothetical protein
MTAAVQVPAIEMTDAVRNILSRRSVLDKIVIAVDCDLAPVDELPIVSMLVREGVMVYLERATLRHVGIVVQGLMRFANVDIYQLTAAGVALCDQHGIPQR